nr:MAG TPA: hypothetical protein [Caudoviricetes sp.]
MKFGSILKGKVLFMGLRQRYPEFVPLPAEAGKR